MIRRDPHLARLEQRSQSVQMLLVLVLVILIIQLWLLTIAVEAYLAAHSTLGWPTFLASGALFAVNLALLRYLYYIDRSEDGP